jgi:hypothetical protein
MILLAAALGQASTVKEQPMNKLNDSLAFLWSAFVLVCIATTGVFAFDRWEMAQERTEFAAAQERMVVYTDLLTRCLNGGSFLVSNTIVMCDATDVVPARGKTLVAKHP